MAYPILDKDGNPIGEYTREEMVALTMKDIETKRQKADVAIAKKARKELENDAQGELDRLNKRTRKKESTTDTSIKDKLFLTIMQALSANFGMFLTKNELFIRAGDGDYSIKITKKKERIAELDEVKAGE